MFSTDSNIANEYYYISNEKIYPKNTFCYKISNTVALFNADGFAQWMKKHWDDSKYKNYKDLANEAKSNPATISRLMNASKQTLTDKPSQPKKDLVERIAKAFQADINEALRLAGYPSDDELVADGLFDGYYELPEDRRTLARKQIAAIIRSLKEEDFEE